MQIVRLQKLYDYFDIREVFIVILCYVTFRISLISEFTMGVPQTFFRVKVSMASVPLFIDYVNGCAGDTKTFHSLAVHKTLSYVLLY